MTIVTDSKPGSFHFRIPNKLTNMEIIGYMASVLIGILQGIIGSGGSILTVLVLV